MDTRPSTGNSSDQEGVRSLHSPQLTGNHPKIANWCTYGQVTFEDASDVTPRPPSHSDRSMSRYLINRRPSSPSTATRDSITEHPLPEMSKGTVGGANGHVEEYWENAPPAKSPLLTAHRISVTSDMDDVSLEEGPYYNSLSLKMRRLARMCYLAGRTGLHSLQHNIHIWHFGMSGAKGKNSQCSNALKLNCMLMDYRICRERRAIIATHTTTEIASTRTHWTSRSIWDHAASEFSTSSSRTRKTNDSYSSTSVKKNK